MSDSIKHSIYAQRTLIKELVGKTLKQYAEEITPLLGDREALDNYLGKIFLRLDYLKYIYVLDEKGVQISSTVNRFGADEEPIGRDRSNRPYMQESLQGAKFSLSEAYISRNKKRPSLTAIQVIEDAQGRGIGFLGVDYDLRELPHSEVIYEEPRQWRQIKGDPAIRSGLFLQQRVESLMDRHIDTVMSVHEELMIHQGVHHFQLHFSSSRSTIWHIDDPYVYRILTMDELANTDICLAYPRRDYFERFIVPPGKIGKILKQFKALRFEDETIYLRSGSLNLVNGKIGLNFSCDGTHYLDYDEFLEKGMDFWFGQGTFPQAVAVASDSEQLDTTQLDNVVEDIAGSGCLKVNKLLYKLEQEAVPEVLKAYSAEERDYIYQELKSVMDVYEGQVCNL